MDRPAGYESIREVFERKIAAYVGKKNAVLCSSARSAIRFSLLALRIGRGDEVVVPDLTCRLLPLVVYCTGAKPKFCDVETDNLALSPDSLSKVLSPNTKAVILVHPLGIPVDPSPFMEIAREKGVALIEDAAQALGASVNGKKAGSFGDLGVFSFNKFLNVKSGGAVVTDSREIADRLKLIRQSFEARSYFAAVCFGFQNLFGLESDRALRAIFLGDNYLHEILSFKFATDRFPIAKGWVEADRSYLDRIVSSKGLQDELLSLSSPYQNYIRRKLETFEVSVLESELENLDSYIRERRRLAESYRNNLSEEGFSKPVVLENVVPSYLRYPITFSDEKRWVACIASLWHLGYRVDYVYKSLHSLPSFRPDNEGQLLSKSLYLSRHMLPLPLHPSLNEGDVQKISSVVNSSIKMQ